MSQCGHSREVSTRITVNTVYANDPSTGYYPRLISFYRSLGVLFRKSNFSYSFSTLTNSGMDERNQIKTTMLYNGSSGLAGVSMPSALWTTYSLFEHRAHIMPMFIFICRVRALWTFLTMTTLLVYCYFRTLFYAVPAFRAQRWKTMTFSAWASATAPRSVVACLLGLDTAWKDYTQSTLLPLFSAVCTAPREDILTHPVEEILGSFLPLAKLLALTSYKTTSG